VILGSSGSPLAATCYSLRNYIFFGDSVKAGFKESQEREGWQGGTHTALCIGILPSQIHGELFDVFQGFKRSGPLQQLPYYLPNATILTTIATEERRATELLTYQVVT